MRDELGELRDEYRRIIECPKCGSHELDEFIFINPTTTGLSDPVYVCRKCHHNGHAIDFRAVPEETDNPSRR